MQLHNEIRMYFVFRVLSILQFNVNYIKILAILVTLATTLDPDFEVIFWASYLLKNLL